MKTLIMTLVVAVVVAVFSTPASAQTCQIEICRLGWTWDKVRCMCVRDTTNELNCHQIVTDEFNANRSAARDCLVSKTLTGAEYAELLSSLGCQEAEEHRVCAKVDNPNITECQGGTGTRCFLPF